MRKHLNKEKELLEQEVSQKFTEKEDNFCGSLPYTMVYKSKHFKWVVHYLTKIFSNHHINYKRFFAL